MSKMALALIRKAKAEKWKSLDLGNCGIDGPLPEEVGKLVDLEELILSSSWRDLATEEWKSSQNNHAPNKISALAAAMPLRLTSLIANSIELIDLGGLADLASLCKLDLCNNQITNIASLRKLIRLTNLSLAKNQVTNISPLAKLTQLTSLSLCQNKIVDISSLATLFQLTDLYLCENQITDISSLAKLSQLTSLDLYENQIIDIVPLGKLTKLTNLFLSENHIADIAPLAKLTQLISLELLENQVDDIVALANLTQLKSLNLASNQIFNIAPLGKLSRLTSLNLSSNHITDITPLANLIQLVSLGLWKNQIVDIVSLANLNQLTILELGRNQVTDIIPIAKLIQLSNLNLRENPITDISPLRFIIEQKGIEVKRGIDRGITVTDCPLTNPPMEIVEQGNEAILKYWDEKESQGTQPIYETKLLIVGEGGAGKTTLLRRLYCPKLDIPDGTESTKGIQILSHAYPIFGDQTMTLNAWDFGGQEIYHATHQFFLTKRSLYVLVDDTRTDDTKAEDAKFKYWLEMIELLGGESPILIFQNEKSGRSKDLDKLGIRKQFPNVHQEFYQGDLIDPAAADKLRSAIADIAQRLPHVGEAWPTKWYAIRQALEEMAVEKPYISLKTYFALYKSLYEDNEEGALRLSAWLHDLGVLLHFQDDDLLRELVILQNEWGTDAVFKMLDDQDVQKQGGYFTEADCTRVWCAHQYQGKQKELRQLMLKFELSYELRDSTPPQWLATQLLPQTPPAHGFGAKIDDLVLQYRYEVMPKGLVARLMVRKNQYVANPKLAWRQGVIFQYRGTEALVYIPYGKKEIHLRARGEEKQILMALISDDLEALNRTFEGLKDKVTKMVPCDCMTCVVLAEPHLYDFDKLLLRKELNKRGIECGNAPFYEVDVLSLLEGMGLSEGQTPMQTMTIFLASSLELKEDREAFEIFVNRQNKQLIRQSIFLHLEIWEDGFEAMSETRSQDEYNKLVRDCDVFVSLFFTRVGKFTEEEFDTAYAQFKKTGRPLIFTYLKEAPVDTSRIDDRILSLLAFKKRLGDLGHFPGKYKNIEDLKEQFSNQLRRVLEARKMR